MAMAGTETGKAKEVYTRMAHPEWGTLQKYGFALDKAAADQPAWMETWRSKAVPTITVDVKLREAMINDPIAALVYVDGEHVNTAFNSAGLANVLANTLDQHHNCDPIAGSVVEASNTWDAWERRTGECSTCGPDGRRVVSEKFEESDDWTPYTHG